METESSGPLKSDYERSRRAAQGWLAWLLGTLATLPTCVSYEPQPLEPDAELAQLLERSREPLQLDDVGPGRSAWFPLTAEVHIDDGVSLAEANALALFYSPEIRRVRADAEIAGALVLQAGVLSNPQLFLGPRISTDDASVIFPAGIGWNLPIWGQESAEHATANAKLTEELLGVVEVELQTLEHVRQLWFRLDRLRRQAAVLEAAATASRQIVDWVEGLARAGESDHVAVFLARNERDEAAVALEQVRIDARQAHRQLLALLGLLPDAPVTFAPAPAAVLPELPEPESAALLAVPALRAAQARYATAEARLKHEITKQYPAVQFGPQFEDDAGDVSIGIGLQFDLPLFDRNRGGIAAATEARVAAREHYRAVLLQSAHGEAEARDRLTAAQRQLQMHERGALRDAETARQSLDVRLRAGTAQVLEVLATHRAIARAQARALELVEEIAAARLRGAIAGGFATEQPTPSPDPGERRP